MDVRAQGYYSTEEELSYMLLLASHRDSPPNSNLIKVKAVCFTELSIIHKNRHAARGEPAMLSGIFDDLCLSK